MKTILLLIPHSHSHSHSYSYSHSLSKCLLLDPSHNAVKNIKLALRERMYGEELKPLAHSLHQSPDMGVNGLSDESVFKSLVFS